MALVTRVGPLEIDHGRDDREVFAYVELRHGAVTNVTLGEDDDRVLEQIARAAIPGEPLECTLDLVQRGRGLGYSLRGVPKDEVALVAAYTLTHAMSPKVRPVGVPLELLREFGYAARDVFRAAPWTYWRDQELRFRTCGWDAVLTVLMENSDAAVNLKEMRAVSDWERYQLAAVLRAGVPRYARLWLQHAFDLNHVPMACHLHGPELGPASEEELMTLIATLRAVSRLSPQVRRATAKEAWRGKTVRVEVEAPISHAS